MLCLYCDREIVTLIGDGFCSLTCWGRYKKEAKPAPKKKRKKLEPHERKKTSGWKERRERVRQLKRDFSAQDWRAALAYFENKCAYCGEKAKMQQEHFLPVHMGGTFTKENVIPACASCNSRKSDKDPFEWLLSQEHGLVAYTRIVQYLGTNA